ncbi:hypothetical protein F5X96DRAFT_659287 [Biscogniauxia mediterranea]|nr:hypothetical protein F5X96DRAFT_659287 [Biscogniauxia mediterranea]
MHTPHSQFFFFHTLSLIPTTITTTTSVGITTTLSTKPKPPLYSVRLTAFPSEVDLHFKLNARSGPYEIAKRLAETKL